MAQIDDGALKNLQGLLREISQRANRLSALIGLERSLLALARKFEDVYKIAETAAGPPVEWSPAIQAKFQAEGRIFQKNDFMDFATDVEGIVVNYPPIASAGASDPTTQVQAWLAGLKSILAEIGSAVPQGPAVLLVACRKFQDTCDDYILARKRMVLQEVKTLATLTEQVQDQLEIPLAV
jgi:hypothetical protein